MTSGPLPAIADPVALLEGAFREAIVEVLGPEHADADPIIRPSNNPAFGDFQANGVMGLAKRLATSPRDLAERIVAAAEPRLEGIGESLEVAGPGFINVQLHTDALASLLEVFDGPELGIEPETDPQPIAIDLCGVNIAKQMHVGHLRSTIIGDTLARVFERLGHPVHRENHLGDWGLTIAMVLAELRHRGADLDAITLTELDAVYRDAQVRCRDDADAETNSRAVLVDLQQGDATAVREWAKVIDVTMHAVYESFDLLGVKLGPENNKPESFYRDRLGEVVTTFLQTGIAREDDGAIVVPFADRERPLLIRKSDGGYLYATTDLAAIRYRVATLGAASVIYIVDARQRDHFRDVFDAARLIGWTTLPSGREADLEHLPFGSVLGTDRKPLKTRDGVQITLRSLLDEAIERGTEEVTRRAADPRSPTHGASAEELAAVGRAVGIGAVKYADLSNDLVRDYVFDLDRMVTFEGNTGPYMQYAHARVCSIFAKADVDPARIAASPLTPNTPQERLLTLTLLRFPRVVRDVSESLEPHRLCTYLYELADAYNAFYENCPVLKAEEAATRDYRLRLCDLTRRVLVDGLDLLGIDAPRRM